MLHSQCHTIGCLSHVALSQGRIHDFYSKETLDYMIWVRSKHMEIGQVKSQLTMLCKQHLELFHIIVVLKMQFPLWIYPLLRVDDREVTAQSQRPFH